MPEDQTDQDVKEAEDVKAAPSPDTSSTQEDSDRSVETPETGNAEQGTDKPDTRTVSLSEHIAARQKYKARIRELEEKAKASEKATTPENREQSGQSDKPEPASVDDIKPEDYDYDPVRIARAVMKAEKAQAEAANRQKEWNGRLSAFDQKVADYAASNPEYDKLLEERGSQNYGDPLIDSTVIEEASPELDHYLSHPDNEEELERIKGLPEGAKLRELGKLAVKAEQWASKRKGSTKPITNAPAPVGVAAGGGKGSATDWRYDGSLDPASYRQRMNGA